MNMYFWWYAGLAIPMSLVLYGLIVLYNIVCHISTIDEHGWHVRTRVTDNQVPIFTTGMVIWPLMVVVLLCVIVYELCKQRFGSLDDVEFSKRVGRWIKRYVLGQN